MAAAKSIVHARPNVWGLRSTMVELGKHAWLEDVVDAAQAAALLGVTRQHVVHLCKTGRLPARRLTSTWVTARQAVDDYARTRRGPGRPRHSTDNILDDCRIISVAERE